MKTETTFNLKPQPIMSAQEWVVEKLKLGMFPLHKRGDVWEYEAPIKPQQLGAFEMAIKEMRVKAKLSEFDYTENGGRKGYAMSIDYKYQHTGGGHNGYSLTFYSFDDCKTFTNSIEL